MAKYELTIEQLQAAKEAKSPEELVAKAKEQGHDITLQRAAEFLDMPLEDGDVSDEELDNVAGGHGGMCHNNGREVVTVGTSCVHKLPIMYPANEKEKKFIRYCGDGNADGYGLLGSTVGKGVEDCEWLIYEKGLWLCNYPEHLKK